ncbi:uncharacterized protein LOC133721843 [Rosa rugosa]|uniref:uncharacterized protein LOC133721843 n=1 Tax=Rosa rugosa TaxID=74645 RepID=UPI002B407E0F|nr:uncharacterized protein LOC133721843 [Rosa rugosa]
MAFSKSMALLATLLVLLPIATYAVDWPDISPSIADEICKRVECGKGTCSFNASEPSAYTCECDKGWKRTAEGNDNLKFLPCVIPNCTLNYTGCQSPPPVPDYTKFPLNLSAFDPCHWVYCGEGSCDKNSTYLYAPECKCNSGASNLLDVSVFPCYKECTLQPDCAALGIKVADSTSTSTNGTTDSNKATDFMPGKFQLMTIVMVSVGMML